MPKKYNGYNSYQYLEAGKDYSDYVMSPQLERVEPYKIELTPEQEELYRQIVADNIIIDLHEHPTVMPADLNQLLSYEREGREITGFRGLANSITDVVFDNMMDGTCIIHSRAGWKWRDVIHDIGMRSCDIDHQDFLIRGEKLTDFYRAREEGKVAWVKALESATMIENELDRIEILYGFGVRMMGITYSESNSLGSGLKERNDGGLTSFGEKALARMNKIGMAVDVSHCGDLTALQVIEKSSKPVFISHIGARKLWDIKRLKPDNVLQACAANGGVIGIEAAPHTTVTENNLSHSIESFMEHFIYIKELVGIDHLAFGPDTLFGDHVGLHRLFSSNMSIAEQTSGKHNPVEYVEGLENPGEVMDNILRWLIKNNYTREEIGKVMGQNIIRVLQDVWN